MRSQGVAMVMGSLGGGTVLVLLGLLLLLLFTVSGLTVICSVEEKARKRFCTTWPADASLKCFTSPGAQMGRRLAKDRLKSGVSSRIIRSFGTSCLLAFSTQVTVSFSASMLPLASYFLENFEVIVLSMLPLASYFLENFELIVCVAWREPAYLLLRRLSLLSLQYREKDLPRRVINVEKLHVHMRKQENKNSSKRKHTLNSNST
jgi:hypothetical protein